MRHGSNTRRRGTTYLEVQVALAILGLALAGLAPAVVAGLRLTARLERRFKPAVVHYLTPAPDAWARKLGASATYSDDDPGTLPAAPAGSPDYEVQVTAFQRSSADDRAVATVTVQKADQGSGGGP